METALTPRCQGVNKRPPGPCTRPGAHEGFCGYHRPRAAKDEDVVDDEHRCKGHVEQGPRKGDDCTFPAVEEGYCKKHASQAPAAMEAAAAVVAALPPRADCRTKCSVVGCKQAPAQGYNRCDRHAEALRHHAQAPRCTALVVQGPRGGQPCRNAAGAGGVCGEHAEAAAREAARTSGGAPRMCGKGERGCTQPVKEGFAKCEACLVKDRERENKAYAARKVADVCVQCGRLGRENGTLMCPGCYAGSRAVEEARIRRDRNYAAEHAANMDVYVAQYRRCAERDGVAFELTPEQCAALSTAACAYCGTRTDGEAGCINRDDTSGPYAEGNVSPACADCSTSKHRLTPSQFRMHCARIAAVAVDPGTVIPAPHTVPRLSRVRYTKSRQDADVRKIVWNLAPDLFDMLSDQPCVYCKAEAGLLGSGIDRMDNAGAYTPANAVSCCHVCNAMKRDRPLHAFLSRAQLVHAHTVPVAPAGPVASAVAATSTVPVASAVPVASTVPVASAVDVTSTVPVASPERAPTVPVKYRAGAMWLAYAAPERGTHLREYVTWCDKAGRSVRYQDRLRQLFVTEGLTQGGFEAALKAARASESAERMNAPATGKLRMKADDIIAHFNMGKTDRYISWHESHHGVDESFRAKVNALADAWERMPTEEAGAKLAAVSLLMESRTRRAEV